MRHVIGIAGTAKNTGKTTTLQAVARYFRSEDRPLFLTSIGYDGEDLDGVTGLPKPKITVEEGDRVATALPLLESSSVVFRDVRATAVQCALGPVYSGTASTLGRVVLAGPASAKDMEAVLDTVPPDCTVLLDGAFSRIAPMSLATHLVFATGAAKHSDPGILASEMQSIAAMMSVPVVEVRTGDPTRAAGLTRDDDAPIASLELPGGLYAEGSEQALADLVASHVARPPLAFRSRGTVPLCRLRVSIDGPVNPGLVESVLQRLGGLSAAVEFVFRHPVDTLLSGDLTSWPSVIALAAKGGHRFTARKASRFLGFTLSPYLPEVDPPLGVERRGRRVLGQAELRLGDDEIEEPESAQSDGQVARPAAHQV